MKITLKEGDIEFFSDRSKFNWSKGDIIVKAPDHEGLGHGTTNQPEGHGEKIAKASKPKTVPMTHRTKVVKAKEASLTRKLRRKLKEFGQKASAAVLDSLPSSKLGKASDADDAKKAAEAAMEAVDWELLVDPTTDDLDAVVRDGVKEALLRVGITDEGITNQAYEIASEWARDRAAEMIGMKYNDDGDLVADASAEFAISETARAEIADKVETAISEGWAAEDLANEIEDVGSFSAERAMMIARTEIIRANNQGHLIAFRESGVVQEKAWSTAEDGDVCPICTENEDEGAIGLEDNFSSGDDAAPAHPNCRCTIVAVIHDQGTAAQEEGE